MKVFFIVIFSLALAGCLAEPHVAPVVNGWHKPAGKQSLYRVQRGDTIYSIAWAYGFDYRALAQANHIPPPYTIKVGQEIKLDVSKSATPAQVVHAPLSRSGKPAPTQVSRSTQTRPVSRTPVNDQVVKHWHWPAKGQIVGRFSPRIGGNMGIDIAGAYGEPVRASSAGQVVYSGSGLRGLGRLIIIKHNAQYLSAYAHNKVLLVKEGERVKAGQKIAEMGRTNSGKAQLHFEIRRNGKPVNPLSFLPNRKQ